MGTGGAILTKKENLEIEKLKRLLEIEKSRSDKMFREWRAVSYENMDLKMQIEAIKKVLNNGN